MSVILLRLSAPMQAWGVQSRFGIRDTGLEPSKSGVLGLLCAALGKPRDENGAENQDLPTLAELAKLRMSVRVLREGVPKVDYHTATNFIKGKNGKTERKETILSSRHYLAGADFLVGLESDDAELLNRLNDAARRPRWQIFFGRKSFVPALPVAVDVFAGDLETVLQDERIWRDKTLGVPSGDAIVRFVIEPKGDEEATEVRQDVPLSFAARRFTIRRVTTKFINLKNGGNKDGNLSDEDDFESALAESPA